MLAFAAAGGLGAAERPNIVYILADDLGWNDVGFHGGTIRTPNLDRLAANGAVLNALYAQPFSSQTRAALLTGRYPMRYGLQTLSLSPSSQYGLPTDERTLAQALKASGYRTAFVGNWLLGACPAGVLARQARLRYLLRLALRAGRAAAAQGAPSGLVPQ